MEKENTAPEAENPEVSPSGSVSRTPLHTIRPILPFLGVMFVILVVSLVLVPFTRHDTAVPPPGSVPTSTPSVSRAPLAPQVISPRTIPASPPEVNRKEITVDLGSITWLAQPVKISPLNIIRPESRSSSPSYDGNENIEENIFYHVANLSGGGRLLEIHTLRNQMVQTRDVTRIFETADKQYVVQKWGEQWDWDRSDAILADSVAYTTQVIPGLEIPDEISTGNLDLARVSYGYTADLFSSLKNPQKITDTAYGPLYQVRTPVFLSHDIYGRIIYLRLKDSTVAEYQIKNSLFTSDGISDITWTDGRKPGRYDQRVEIGGCGANVGGTPIIVDNSALLQGMEDVGHASSGEHVYQVTDPQNEFVKNLYEKIYASTRSDPEAVAQYASEPNHFLWKDPLGDWQIFVSADYAYLAECAKPVIYLYPQKRQNVSVSVAADIRQSDPFYPSGGWQVIADPSGLIHSQGKTYPYLYWDGVGRGIYPDYRDRGVVVPGEDVESVLRSQLAAQGLTPAEAGDFLKYWLPLLPADPYIRLTWLGTEDMDLLAPLTVSPRPDTVIRVFLEFEGMLTPRVLSPQHFVSPARTGFTLVEWGGLRTGLR